MPGRCQCRRHRCTDAARLDRRPTTPSNDTRDTNRAPKRTNSTRNQRKMHGNTLHASDTHTLEFEVNDAHAETKSDVVSTHSDVCGAHVGEGCGSHNTVHSQAYAI